MKITGMASGGSTEPMSSHLLINPFGDATLLYLDKEVANSNEATKHPIGTIDFKFLIRVNRNGSFDIQHKATNPFNVTIETTAKICQVKVGAGAIHVPPWYTVKEDVLCQKYSVRQTAEFAEGHFRVKLINSSIFRRVDVRYQQHSWATMIITQNQLLKMCLNATRELDIMQWACVDIIDKVKSQPTEVTAKQLGLAAERVEKRQDDDNRSVQSVASSSRTKKPTLLQMLTANEPTTPKPEVSMPKLVPNSTLDQVRAEYIEKLEKELAALKIPPFNIHSDAQN